MPQSVSVDLDFLAIDILVAETTVDDDVVSEDPSIVVVAVDYMVVVGYIVDGHNEIVSCNLKLLDHPIRFVDFF